MNLRFRYLFKTFHFPRRILVVRSVNKPDANPLSPVRLNGLQPWEGQFWRIAFANVALEEKFHILLPPEDLFTLSNGPFTQ